MDVEFDNAYESTIVFWLAYRQVNRHNLVYSKQFVYSRDHVFVAYSASSSECMSTNWLKESCYLFQVFDVAYQNVCAHQRSHYIVSLMRLNIIEKNYSAQTQTSSTPTNRWLAIYVQLWTYVWEFSRTEYLSKMVIEAFLYWY